MTENNDTPPQTNSPVKRVAQSLRDLPNNMTAKSLSTLAGALHGKEHPAAQLARMNEELLTLMMEEGEQERLLRRQAQTLDALFHLMIDHGINIPKKEHMALRADMTNLAAALKAQRQCFETIQGLNNMDYKNSMKSFIENKPPEDFIQRLANRPQSRGGFLKNDLPEDPFAQIGKQTEDEG